MADKLSRTVSHTPTSKHAPSPSGVPHPVDPGKKNGVVWNPVTYQYFGGCPQPFNQKGEEMPQGIAAKDGQNAAGPISDRGRGRG